MTATIRLAAVDGVAIDPIIAAHTPRSTAARLRDSREVIAKFNGDQARNERMEALMRSQPGPTMRRFLDAWPKSLTRTALRQTEPISREVPHVIIHQPISKPYLPLFDHADSPRGIPDAIAWPLEVLLRSYEHPGSVKVDAVLAAVAAIREYSTPPSVESPAVGEGNDPDGIVRPDGVA